MADNYSVTSQRQTSRLSPGGQFEQGMEVRFRTVTGTDGMVFIPLSRYNAENVHAAIADYVAHIDAVNQL